MLQTLPLSKVHANPCPTADGPVLLPSRSEESAEEEEKECGGGDVAGAFGTVRREFEKDLDMGTRLHRTGTFPALEC